MGEAQNSMGQGSRVNNLISPFAPVASLLAIKYFDISLAPLKSIVSSKSHPSSLEKKGGVHVFLDPAYSKRYGHRTLVLSAVGLK